VYCNAHICDVCGLLLIRTTRSTHTTCASSAHYVFAYVGVVCPGAHLRSKNVFLCVLLNTYNTKTTLPSNMARILVVAESYNNTVPNMDGADCQNRVLFVLQESRKVSQAPSAKQRWPARSWRRTCAASILSALDVTLPDATRRRSCNCTGTGLSPLRSSTKILYGRWEYHA
jgi:hypothetical protein